MSASFALDILTAVCFLNCFHNFSTTATHKCFTGGKKWPTTGDVWGSLTLSWSLNGSHLFSKLTQTIFAVGVGTKCDDDLADGYLKLGVGGLLRAVAQKMRCHNSGL